MLYNITYSHYFHLYWTVMDISDRKRSSGSPKFDEDLKVVTSDSDIPTEPVDDEITSGDPAAHRLRADIQCFGDLWDGIHRSDF